MIPLLRFRCPLTESGQSLILRMGTVLGALHKRRPRCLFEMLSSKRTVPILETLRGNCLVYSIISPLPASPSVVPPPVIMSLPSGRLLPGGSGSGSGSGFEGSGFEGSGAGASGSGAGASGWGTTGAGSGVTGAGSGAGAGAGAGSGAGAGAGAGLELPLEGLLLEEPPLEEPPLDDEPLLLLEVLVAAGAGVAVGAAEVAAGAAVFALVSCFAASFLSVFLVVFALSLLVRVTPSAGVTITRVLPTARTVSPSTAFSLTTSDAAASDSTASLSAALSATSLSAASEFTSAASSLSSAYTMVWTMHSPSPTAVTLPFSSTVATSSLVDS